MTPLSLCHVLSSKAQGFGVAEWHALTVEECLRELNTIAWRGLSEEQVQENLAEYGPNKLDEQEKKSLFQLVVEQFEDTLVRILLVSAGVSFALAYFDEASAEEGIAAYVEPIVILTILILISI